MEKSGFFADIEGDRGYTDDFLAEWVASFIENGVYNTELGVMAAGDMNITVQPGRAWINGRIYILTEALTIPVEVSDGKLNRYTSIVLRADANARKITVQAVDGTYSAQPTAPNITRNSEIYELKLADIYVAAGAISISQAEITDTRLDNEVCGLVYCPVEHIDTESLYNQIQTDLTNFRNISQKEFDAWFSAFISSANGNISEYENSFLVWFEHMKDQLSEDAAGNLQTQVDNLNNAALGGGLVMKGNPISIEAAGANRIDSLTLYGENAQGGTTEAPVALTGVDSVFVGGNNLLPNKAKTNTVAGITYTVNPDKSITAKGTAASWGNIVIDANFSLPAGTYTLNSNTQAAGVNLAIGKDTTGTKNIAVSLTTSKTFELPTLIKHCVAYIAVAPDSVVDTTIRPMLNLGSTAMPYEPYQGSVTPLPIPRPLHKVGDVRDVCRTRVKSVYDKRIVLDGAEDWKMGSAVGDGAPYIFCDLLNDHYQAFLIISSRFPSTNILASNKNQGIGCWDRSLYLRYDSLFTNVEELKTYLSAHPLTVYYQSTAYDGTNGLDVCLMKYQTGFVELDGTEDVVFDTYGNTQKRIRFDLDRNAIARYALKFSHGDPGDTPTATGGISARFNRDVLNRFQIIGIADTWTALGVTDTATAKTWLAAQKEAGTPVQIAYQLATPETYATDPIDFDNAAGPLTVLTGGAVEVRMTELVGSRSPELAGKMDKATYDADGDGVVNEAEKVSNALTLKNAAGEVVATFDGSEAAILQLTAALVGALGKTEKAADSSKLAGLTPVIDNPGPSNRNSWYFPFTGTNNRDGTRKYYAALYADNATTAGRASNLSMGLSGTDLWVYYS